ncbi:unnamed protein product [Alopecurus aequalis]
MAVADPAVKPSPAARIFAHPAVKPSPAARIVALALLYLCLAIGWITTAVVTASIVAPLLLFGLDLSYLVAVVSGSTSEFKKIACGAITQEPIPKLLRAMVLEIVADLPRAVVLGVVADLALILLTAAGTLVEVMSPHVERSMSQGQMIGSAIEDVGSFGMGAISCLVIFPGLALFIWRVDSRCGPWRHNPEPKV